jgi:hypothetical protein
MKIFHTLGTAFAESCHNFAKGLELDKFAKLATPGEMTAASMQETRTVAGNLRLLEHLLNLRTAYWQLPRTAQVGVRATATLATPALAVSPRPAQQAGRNQGPHQVRSPAAPVGRFDAQASLYPL